MVAIARAESGGNSEAVSPTNDYGLWQENIANFAAYGMTADNWTDVDVQARAAIQQSGNGIDVHAWSTAYTDIASEGFKSSLPALEPGSPAAAFVGSVIGDLAGGLFLAPPAAGAPPPVAGGGEGGDLADSFSALAGWLNSGKPAAYDQMRGLNDLILGVLQ